MVLPGIIDGHTHLVMFGGSLAKADCLGKTAAQVQEIIKAERVAKPHQPFVLGRSFLFDALGQDPHKSLLDAAVSDVPVIIDSADLHSTWLNSAALKAVGVGRDTPNPKGGEFERDADGELTGLCLETAVVEYVWPWVSKQMTHEDRVRMLDDVFEEYLSTGITGCIDMAMTDEDLAAIEAVYARNQSLPIRVAVHFLLRPDGTDESRAEQVTAAAAQRKRLEPYAPWLQVAGVKVISDGVVDSCTAFLKEPYADGTKAGPIWPGDELAKVVVLADSLDLQIAVHAIGDAASEQALDAFEAAIKVNGPRPLRRHRLEHLEVVTPESIQRLTRLGIVASLQPVHADPVYVPNWRKMLGEDKRCDRAFPWTEYVEANSKVAFGSDAPTAPHHPFPNMYTATTRQSAVNPTLKPDTDPRIVALERFCLKLDTSIRFYTSGSAYSMRGEDSYGTLEAGKSADFCVISIDPFQDGVETLREAQKAVTQTWVAGKLAWEKS